METKEKITLTLTDVAFLVGPGINADGRMKHGGYAVELLTRTKSKYSPENSSRY